MGRDHGAKKFSFPLPRRSRTKVDDTHNHDDVRSIPSTTSVHEWPIHHEESSSKAHRLLGTSDALYRSTSGQTSIPASPGYMSITVSEASFGSQIDERNPAMETATDNRGYPKRPGISKRPSSNILGRTYTGGSRQASDNSSVSHRLHTQTSNSTLRSHYDAKNSPMYISQQTSDSAVRDRALRRGHPPVLTDNGYGGYEGSPVSPTIQEETRKQEQRKSKPAKLDLSKLFPKPGGAEGQNFGNALLSPTKMVNSPAAMSINSGYFPRPMTREPTPQAGGHNKLQKAPRHHIPAVRAPTSPVRKFQRDEYDNAKVHVRRPPRGVQHWFDALDEDSDESTEDRQHVYAPKAVRPNATVPARGPIVSQLSRERLRLDYDPRSHDSMPAYRKDTFALEDIVDITHLTSPSQFSVDTHYSHASSKNKESALSKNNLQDSSVLSFSSSEDEADSGYSRASRVPVRKSLESGDYTGEIVIGQAQAYEVRPHHRKQSSGRISTLSTSTNAATIDIMYTPEPPFPSYHYPRSSMHSSSRRSSHARQPSVIHEVDDTRSMTAFHMPLSPMAHSVMSARTSASAPQPQPYSDKSHKMMEVTAEEEALLEMMRKRRAAMNKQPTPPKADKPAPEYDQRLKSPHEAPRRTSGFLSMSLESSPVRVVEAKTKQRIPAHAPSPLVLPQRGRSGKAEYVGNVSMSQLRDSSTSDTWSDRHPSPTSRGRLPHYLPTPSVFSPLDPFPPSPTLAASVASPTTTDHPSPLPSPITPGYSMCEKDVAVKVANSETSNEIEDLSLLDNGVIGAPPEPTKPDPSHRRCRTASSDAEINFPAPPTSTPFRDLSSVSEASSSRPPSIVEPPVPKLPRKVVRHISELALSASSNSRSRQSSVHSVGSRTSNYSQASSYLTGGNDKRSTHLSPEDPGRAVREERDSVCDDVLAAWGSLGGRMTY
jgi:hypothetical protein